MQLKAPGIRSTEERMHFLIRNLFECLGRPIDFGALAEGAGFCRFGFYGLFRDALGESPGEFIQRIHMERAAWELIRTQKPFGDIAFEARYASGEAFAMAFKSAFGSSPRDYRASRGRLPELTAPSGVHYRPDGRFRLILPSSPDGPLSIEKRQQGPMELVAFRHRGPLHGMSAKFGLLAGWAAPLDVPLEAGYALYYDDPETTPGAEIRSDAAMPAPTGASIPRIYEPGDGELHRVALQGGSYAVARYIGAYDGLMAAWGRFMRAVVDEGLRPLQTPCFERYLVGSAAAGPDSAVTELWAPIAPDSTSFGR